MNELHYQLDLLKAMNKKLSAKERMYKMICDSSACAYLYYSVEKNEIVTMGRWKDFFDFEIRDIKDLTMLLDAMDEFSSMKLLDVLYLEKKHEDQLSVECKNRDGDTWYEVKATAQYDEYGQVQDKLLSIRDITKVKHQNEELVYMAHYDNLTGLYNRNFFVSLLGSYIRSANKESDIISVMVIDIDDFKKVNDGLGMVAGDELIQVFGTFLKQFINDKVLVCHLNNDVYCIAIDGPSGNNTVTHIYEEILRRIREPFVLSSGRNVMITVSVGVAEYPEAATSALELINCAEIVMFRSKDSGKGTIQYFDTFILNDFLGNIEMENRLKEAVFNSNFVLYYQPQFYAGNKKLRGMEALIRWRDDNGNMISPNVFIPIAEKNGCIVPIGNWVVEQSIRQYSVWRDKYGIPFTLSINISAVQYNDSQFVPSLLALLEKYHVAPRDIEIEMTESVLIDDFDEVYEKLKVLRQSGVRISLDDFGTGFSSLSYLKKLPIDTLKIDKSFIDTVLTDSTTRIITESIINMMKSLRYESIAEGVEEEAQYNYLHAIGCDVIQGYLFSKPKTVDEIEEMLQEIL